MLHADPLFLRVRRGSARLIEKIPYFKSPSERYGVNISRHWHNLASRQLYAQSGISRDDWLVAPLREFPFAISFFAWRAAMNGRVYS